MSIDPEAKESPAKLSAREAAILANLAAGRPFWHGAKSKSHAAQMTRLRALGLIQGFSKITDAGREWLASQPAEAD